MKKLFIAAAALGAGVNYSPAFNYDAGANRYTCDGSQADIQAAINDATAHHPASSYSHAATVLMTGPGPGTVALGINNVPITFGTCVILSGNGNTGANSTVVTLPSIWSGNGATFNSRAVIQLSNGAWVSNFSVPQAMSGTPLFSVANGTKGARITGISYNTDGTANTAYFCIIACSGTTLSQVTIDNNLIVPGGGSNELIFARGPTNAWQIADSWGSPDQIYIEANQFGLSGSGTGGYVCDFNSNTIGTVRFNTIYGRIKIDGHGSASNTPNRGVRQMEIYGNRFLGSFNNFQAMEIRGGASRNFMNTALNAAITNPTSSDYITYDDYGCLLQGGTFNGVWQTPSNYPILDQVGEGRDVDGHQAPGGSDPAYMWLNRIDYGIEGALSASWEPNTKTIQSNTSGGAYQVSPDAYPTGATTIKLSTQSSSLIAGTMTDSHGTWQNAVAIGSDKSRYIIATTTTSAQAELVIAAKGLEQSIAAESSPKVSCNAEINWQQQTGNPNGTFNIASYVPNTPNTVILANRDIFVQSTTQWGDGSTGSYDGTEGVNFGTTAAMNSKTPTQAGVGWWVTDKGSWNSGLAPNTSGELYVWNGSAWVLNYIPYQYPYYLPVFSTQPISVIVTDGNVALSAEASNTPSYQWCLDGTPVNGATSPIFEMQGPNLIPGSYTCVASNSSGTAISEAATVSISNTTNGGRLTNLSYRTLVGAGADALVLGFSSGGSGTVGAEPLLIRGSGPALVPFGITGALSDPQIQLYAGTQMLATNEGWGGNPGISGAAAVVGAFPWTNPASKDAAFLKSLSEGPYTFQVAPQSGDSGIALAEIYDATPSGAYTPASPRLINLSARVQVNGTAAPPTVGFVIGGMGSVTVLIRVSGPALAPFGIVGALPDPQLQLYQVSGNGTATLIGSNAGWGGDPQKAAAAAAVGAFSWGNAATADSALLVTLPSGAYTVQVSGTSGDPGTALTEVYEVR